MPATVNEQLRDADIGHQVDLQRYANGIVRRLLALLNRTDSDLAVQIAAAVDRLPVSVFTFERLEAMLGSVRELNAMVYEELHGELRQELRDLTEYEAGYQLQLFRSAIPPQVVARVGINAVSIEQTYAAAMARPFQGRLLREWASSIEADRMARVRDAIRIGYVENQTIPQIVQRIRGTRARGYADGLLDIDRRHAEAVVRTAISHTAAFVRNEFMSANSDLVAAVVWSSTLDSRTSEPCRLRDGLKYDAQTHKPIGHKLPWGGGPGAFHWNCRSVSTPVTKSWRSLGLNMDEFAPATRASMDGQVPAEQTYGEWLKRQSAARQDDILGPARGALLRKGGLTIDRFASDKGRWLSLSELKERDAEAFKRAGL